MKNDTLATLMARLILATGVLLLFAWDANAGSGKMRSADEMVGTLEIGEKATNLITVGDRVKVALKKPDSVMPGDRLDIWETTKTNMEDDKGNDLVALVGRLVVTEAEKNKVIGYVEAAHHEIFTGSYVNYSLKEAIQNDRYFGFLKNIANLIKEPEKETLTVALLDVTDKKGNVTLFTEAVFRELNESICTRPQIKCVDRKDLREFLGLYNLPTSYSIDRYMRRKIAARFGAAQLITATVEFIEKKTSRGMAERTGKIGISVSAYDLVDQVSVRSVNLEANSADYPLIGGNPEEILFTGEKTRHGYLTIGLSHTAPLKGRRVDSLFMVSLDDAVEKKYRKYVSDTSSDDIIFGNVELEMDGKPLAPDRKNGIYYKDIIKSGQHLLKVSMTPSLIGKGELPIGRKIEKNVLIEIAPDSAFNTDVVLRVYGRQGIIVIDTIKRSEAIIEGIDF